MHTTKQVDSLVGQQIVQGCLGCVRLPKVIILGQRARHGIAQDGDVLAEGDVTTKMVDKCACVDGRKVVVQRYIGRLLLDRLNFVV